MTKNFKEIGKKAEALIEQGKEADQKIQSCQARVVSSSSRVAAARRELDAASETDEEGNPVGDVASARAQLSMAQNQLAASQRALSSARTDADRVRQQKNVHVQEIEKHNQVERSNLEKLRRLKASAFGEDSAALTEGIAQRLNEAEDAKAALLRSMGMDATPDYAVVEGEGSAAPGWQGGGFAALDTAGQVQSYRGGGSEGVSSGSTIAAPVGGGLGAVGAAPAWQQENAGYTRLFGEETTTAIDIDHVVSQQMTNGKTDRAAQWNRRPRSPDEILSDMKESMKDNWMNNFNADEWKQILPEKLYLERVELYRKGIAAVIGDKAAESLELEDLEYLSRVQNRAYLSDCKLDREDISELYNNASKHLGNFVPQKIEYKMDRQMQARAHGLLQTEKYSQNTWNNLSVVERKDVLRDLLIDMNSILGTDVSADIDFYSGSLNSRGRYSSQSNRVSINEAILSGDTGYQLTQTMLHEMRHAYQHYSVENDRNVLVSSQTIMTWNNNFYNYKSPDKGDTYEEYFTQPVEWDAKNFAKQFTDIMGINPEYKGSWS